MSSPALDAWSVQSSSVESRGKMLVGEQKGMDIMNDPLLNKGMAFSVSERDRLHLHGLLPPKIEDLEAQCERVMRKLRAEPDSILKNLQMQELHDQNETVFHRVLVEHMEELASLIYTPTVGHACEQFGSDFGRSRGMYFSRQNRGDFSALVRNWPHDEVHVLCVTDGSRVLGLGDLGAHGMGIPIGKLALYVAAGGIAPHRVMPVVLDVGTNNEALRGDTDYLGVREPRLDGTEYFDLVDEFMAAVFGRWPRIVVQFEDFATPKAFPLLAKYRSKYRCFNDDIQGTGCVALAGVMAAARQASTPLTELRFVCAGAGAAGLGACAQIVNAMVEQGMDRHEAMQRFVVCTSQGAIGKHDRVHGSPNHARGLSCDRAPWQNDTVSDGTSLHMVIRSFRPSCLLGLAGQPSGIFREDMIREIAEIHPAPILLPLSNPTTKAECTPAQAYEWSGGRGIVATGSPFGKVTLADGTTRIPSQCNNMYVFPGLGLAASVAGIAEITDGMLFAAAVACVDSLTPEEVAEGRTFPELSRARQVSHAVACAVIEKAFSEGVATLLKQEEVPTWEALQGFVREKMYFPVYVPLVDTP